MVSNCNAESNRAGKCGGRDKCPRIKNCSYPAALTLIAIEIVSCFPMFKKNEKHKLVTLVPLNTNCLL
ncbi:Uncharacterized protein APZ42_005291 [Daphnia magna]|uniref:Uncharacterized protein n=1 Tax=Daphnia magna TaxID=35525 RepID=A0A162CTP0_9CRUS|nr:Uncharacterized protein APZ42_005291 [Daphnia magna]